MGVDPSWLLLPTSREEAKAIGANRYFTGRLCQAGHISLRNAEGRCLECERARGAKRRSRPDYNEKLNALARKRYAADPEKHRLIVKTKREANIQRTREKERAEYLRNKPTRMARRKRWRTNNPDAVTAQSNRRRASKLRVGGTYQASDIAAILKRQKYQCAECRVSVKRKKDRHVDHIMPLSLGGTNAPNNLQVLCVTCNLRKGALHPVDWANRNGRLV